MSEPKTFTIKIRDRGAEREVALRRPTHGQLDLGALERLGGIYFAYQKRIREAEALPEPGVALRVANFVEIANDAAREVRERILRAAPEIAVPAEGFDLAEWLRANGDEAVATGRALGLAFAIAEALMPQGLVPKSPPS